jgi:acetyltransferase-like isoleucine patch superfamily enzyme
MRFAGLSKRGRIAMFLAVSFTPPYKNRISLAFMNSVGFLEYSAVIHHLNLSFGKNCYIGDRVVIFERKGKGCVKFGDRVEILRDTTIETGNNGSVSIGNDSSIHPSCHLYAYKEAIKIGSGVMIAPSCALYSYDHGIEGAAAIRKQPVKSKGPVIIGDDVWIGVNVVVLSGVTIGNGAVIGAGSVVTHDIAENSIAFGNPARVIKMRSEIN